ncbi:MAG: TAXI family TRAP transporter solute-binding subunit [Streptosporangiales bacterium]|nr:TAXI family TRAP transporter solute-binding subunit [Streptosporangiales bacterium]
MKKRLVKLLAPALVVGLVATASGCGGKQEPEAVGGGKCEAGSGSITIATGNSTGVYYVVGGGLAQVISKNTDLKATAAETGASVQNIEQLVDGTYDVAFSLSDTAADAVNGNESFDQPQPVRALTNLYPNTTHVVVRADSGIDSLEDMKGKTISTGSPKSGTEVIANRLLEQAGVDPAKDIKAQRLDMVKTADGMKDGTIDGLFWSGGLPTPQITDLFTSLGDKVKFIDVSPMLPKMKEINDVYEASTISKDVYKTPEDIKTFDTPNVLLVKDDFAKSNACAITKLIFDKKQQLVKVHPASKDISLDTARQTTPVKLHPGAEQALDELKAPK